MAAVSDALRSVEGLTLKDIECLSLGTGVYSESLDDKTEGWGLLGWAMPITTIMMQASSKSSTYEASELLKKHLRLQINIYDKKKSDMADSSPQTAKYIIERVEKDIFENERKMEELKKFFK
jgi:hypothetical protein